ncbi:hypothetical protein VJ918_07835 [Adlercreutzia sp. R21]|uniref:hypothetical protein n=1 Tax=Adlercreutzia wanghongyangiae TaxID=3111451 RepID=UPI002DBBC060|nr:hypothetical protein [Adlercreutzia sp. R21]MEC4184716.1 hypothetical protein [Adlercreutzia sp. R21]
MIDVSPDDYVACICEGPSETTVMNLLLEEGALCFDKGQLLDGKLLPSKFFRDPKLFVDRYLTMDFEGRKICVLLIQDRKNTKYAIRNPYLEKVGIVAYVITAPEIEMLMIHSRGLYNDYKKRSSHIKPSVYLAEQTKTSTAKIKSEGYIRQFYGSHNLVEAIRTHKKKSQNLGGDKYFLADLLR